jgi:hypothetical protein
VSVNFERWSGLRAKNSQRTKAGLERTRAMGTLLGRPKFSDGDRQKLHTALDTGENWHAASMATKIPSGTVKKHAACDGWWVVGGGLHPRGEPT